MGLSQLGVQCLYSGFLGGGESSPECPREGLGEQPCTPTEALTPDLHHGSITSQQPLQAPGCSKLPWGIQGRGSCKPHHG